MRTAVHTGARALGRSRPPGPGRLLHPNHERPSLITMNKATVWLLSMFTRTAGKTGFVQLVIGIIFEFHVGTSHRCTEKTTFFGVFELVSLQERTTQGYRQVGLKRRENEFSF